MTTLATEWDPKDYLWDPEALTAVRLNSGAAPNDSENLQDKRTQPKSALVICQIDGCEIRLDSTYYRASLNICPLARSCFCQMVKRMT